MENNLYKDIHAAAANGRQAVVDLLIKAKSDPTAVNVNGNTTAKYAERRSYAWFDQQLRKSAASHQEAGMVNARLGTRFHFFAV